MPYLIYDVVDLRNHFERQYDTSSKLYISHNPSYAKWINDDLQQNLSEALTIFVKDCIRRLFDASNKQKLDMGLQLIVINEIDQRDSTCSYLDNIRSKVDGLLSNNEQAARIIDNYIKRG